LAIRPGHILQAIPNLMNNTALDLRFGKDSQDSVLEASQPIHAGDEDVLYTARLQVGYDTQPEVGAFAAFPDPMPQNISLAFQVHAQDRIHGSIHDLAVQPQLDVDRIQVNHGIDACQRPVLPGFHQIPDFVRDGTQGGGRNLHAIQLL